MSLVVALHHTRGWLFLIISKIVVSKTLNSLLDIFTNAGYKRFELFSLITACQSLRLLDKTVV